MRTSQALASSRGAKGEKAIRPSIRIFLYRDSVTQDEPDIWRHFYTPIGGEELSSDWFYRYKFCEALLVT